MPSCLAPIHLANTICVRKTSIALLTLHRNTKLALPTNSLISCRFRIFRTPKQPIRLLVTPYLIDIRGFFWPTHRRQIRIHSFYSAPWRKCRGNGISKGHPTDSRVEVCSPWNLSENKKSENFGAIYRASGWKTIHMILKLAPSSACPS